MMIPWFPRSACGAVLAVLYLAVAVGAVLSDRSSAGGGWITLNGMGSFLVTFPVSLVAEKLGFRPDYRRNLDMLFAIGVCAVLMYLIGAGLGRLTRVVFTGGGAA